MELRLEIRVSNILVSKEPVLLKGMFKAKIMEKLSKKKETGKEN